MDAGLDAKEKSTTSCPCQESLVPNEHRQSELCELLHHQLYLHCTSPLSTAQALLCLSNKTLTLQKWITERERTHIEGGSGGRHTEKR